MNNDCSFSQSVHISSQPKWKRDSGNCALLPITALIAFRNIQPDGELKILLAFGVLDLVGPHLPNCGILHCSAGKVISW